MPIEYTLENSGTLVLAKATGVLGVDCFLSMQKRMRNDGNLRTPHRTLLDVRFVADIRITEDDLTSIAENLTAEHKKLGADKLAIVAMQQQAFLLGMKYGEIEKDVAETVIVFFDPDIARTWLGVR